MVLCCMFSQQDSLMFSMVNGGIDLIQTEFCREIDPSAFALLTVNKSFPLFLANVTSDLFGKTTMG